MSLSNIFQKNLRVHQAPSSQCSILIVSPWPEKLSGTIIQCSNIATNHLTNSKFQPKPGSAVNLLAQRQESSVITLTSYRFIRYIITLQFKTILNRECVETFHELKTLFLMAVTFDGLLQQALQQVRAALTQNK